MEIWGFVLGGAAVAAMIKLIESVIMHFLGHRSKEGKEYKAFRVALKAVLRDRLRYLCRCYLKDGYIGYDDQDDLIEMYESYKALGGNGSLDAAIKRVLELPVKTQ